MSKGAINFSTDNEYYTPKNIVSMFGNFEYDPATTTEKALDLNIPNYDTKDTDGLQADWTIYKRIWINPPFTKKHLFLQKACETYRKTKADIFFICPIGFLTTKRFRDCVSICGGVKIYLPQGRIKFQSGLGKPSQSPAFGSVVLKISNKMEVELIELPQ